MSVVGSLSNELMNIQGVGLGFPPVGSGDLCNNRSTPAGPVQIFQYPRSDRTSPVQRTVFRHQGERYSPCWPDLEVITTGSLGISAISNIAHWPPDTPMTFGVRIVFLDPIFFVIWRSYALVGSAVSCHSRQPVFRWLRPLGPARIDKSGIFVVNYSIVELRLSVEFASRSIFLVVWLLFTSCQNGGWRQSRDLLLSVCSKSWFQNLCRGSGREFVCVLVVYFD